MLNQAATGARARAVCEQGGAISWDSAAADALSRRRASDRGHTVVKAKQTAFGAWLHPQNGCCGETLPICLVDLQSREGPGAPSGPPDGAAARPSKQHAFKHTQAGPVGVPAVALPRLRTCCCEAAALLAACSATAARRASRLMSAGGCRPDRLFGRLHAKWLDSQALPASRSLTPFMAANKNTKHESRMAATRCCGIWLHRCHELRDLGDSPASRGGASSQQRG